MPEKCWRYILEVVLEVVVVMAAPHRLAPRNDATSAQLLLLRRHY